MFSAGYTTSQHMPESKPQNRPVSYARVSTYGQILDVQLEQLQSRMHEALPREGHWRAGRSARLEDAESHWRRRCGHGDTYRPPRAQLMIAVPGGLADVGRI
jgi:hypothetical protein